MKKENPAILNKVKNAAARILLFLASLLVGVAIFHLLTTIGDKNKGPLEDLLSSADFSISRMERNVLRKDNRNSRSAKLNWFYKYRVNKDLLNSADTFLWGIYDDNTAESYESIIDIEDSLKSQFPVISMYTAWGSEKNQVFPQLRAQAIADLGSIPMITWEPWLDDFDPAEFPVMEGKTFKNYKGLRDIASGNFDKYIDKWAAAIKSFGQPVMLRWGHEMNDPYRYPWGPQNNEPQDYIDAWRYLRERFEIAGAKNVIWVWSPHPGYSTFPQFYPGHDYVDWIGVTTLNYGTAATWSQWWSFDDIFRNFYDSVSTYGKPILVTEFGSLAVGGNRAEWFGQAFNSITTKYPSLKGLVFFHATNDNTTTYKSLDWSFENDPATLNVIRNSIQSWSANRENPPE